MSKNSKMKLNPSCIESIPFQIYDNDFSFVVNGKEFKTNRFISDLISPTMCKMHLTDSTFNTFEINTDHQGDFSLFLKLIRFNEIDIPDNELPFIMEVIKILGNDYLRLEENISGIELTIDNVFQQLLEHEKYPKFYSKLIETEIDFISSHFDELFESHKENLKSLQIDTLIKVITSPKLQLVNEDQLLRFVNELYIQNSEYSNLYEYVYFVNVSTEMMKEFINVFSYYDMTNSSWSKISERLVNNSYSNKFSQNCEGRYKDIKKELLFTGDNEFKGIVNYLRTESNDKIERKINYSSSSLFSGNYKSINSSFFDDNEKVFESSHEGSNWICLHFIENSVIPFNYTVRSIKWFDKDHYNPKSWVVEGSNDNGSWITLSEVNDCSYLNGPYLSHTFKIDNENSKEFKFIRMRLTGLNWHGTNFLGIDSFEIYGRLI